MPSEADMDRERVAADMLAELQDEMRKMPVSDYLVYLMQSVSAMGSPSARSIARDGRRTRP